ncbi:MAG: hypothetical protein AAF337_00200 [Pseudomonadota bacterium]
MDTPSIVVVMLATKEIEAYAAHTSGNWQAYCQRHGYQFERVLKASLTDMHVYWSKVACLIEKLEQGQHDWVFVVDADTVVHRMEITLESLIERWAPTPQTHVLISEDCSRRFGLPFPLSFKTMVFSRTLRGANSGFFGFRVSDLGREIAARWLELGRTTYAQFAYEAPHEQAVFWLGIQQPYRQHIQVIGRDVLRIGGNPLLDRLCTDTSQAFVLHDKQLKQRDAA